MSDYNETTCPHCGGYDDWSDIEWEDPCCEKLAAWLRCPNCGGLHKLIWKLADNIPVEG